MPTVLTETVPAAPPPESPRKKWTRAECEELEKTGLFDGQYLELIEGDLLDKMGKRRAHVNSLTLLGKWLIQVFGADFVNYKAPIDVADEDNRINEPQPDAIVLRRKTTDFVSGNPQPEDLQLVVEVADSSLQMDLQVKARLYARAGIVEYWILDIKGRRLIAHRSPEMGRYSSVVAYGAQERVAPLAAPASELRVADVFVG